MVRTRSFFQRPVLVAALIGAGVLAVLSGCMTPAIDDVARTGPFFKPVNHAGDASLPASLHRVVVLPLSAPAGSTSDAVAAFDSVFAAELLKQNRFEVVTVSRNEFLRRFGAEALGSAAALPHDLLSWLQREYAPDAVLFIDLTTFRAYHPLALGVRAKLASIDGSRLIWTFDNVFSAADPAVANSARRHFLESDRGGVPADMSFSVLQSPSQFAAYVAAATFATLPPVYTTPPPLQTSGVQH